MGKGRQAPRRPPPIRLPLALAVLALAGLPAAAQNAPPPGAAAGRGAYQIPDKIYAGDVGTLVYPLDAFYLDAREARVSWDEAAAREDVTVISCEIDRSGRALVARFQAWRAGVVVLPPFTLGGEELSGLRVRIDSVLDAPDAALVLLPQKGPLTAPGTFWLLFGSALGLILLLFTALAAFLYGRTFWRAASRAARIYRPRRRLLRRVGAARRALEKGRLETAAFLALLCREFRAFAGGVYGVECAAFTPDDFARPGAGLGGARIAGFLRAADALRFSGRAASKERALDFCAGLRREADYHCAFAAERERRGEGGAAGKGGGA